MSVEKMHLFSEMVSRLVSKIDNKKITIEGLQKGIQLIKEQLEKARADRMNFTYNRIIPFLRDIAESYKKRELTESQRDELLQGAKKALVPLNDKIQEYEETIQLLEQRIHILDEQIQKTGGKIHALMVSHQAEAAQLHPETAQDIFSYTRFNFSPALFQAQLAAKDTKPPATVAEAFEQYTSSHSMGQSKGS